MFNADLSSDFPDGQKTSQRSVLVKERLSLAFLISSAIHLPNKCYLRTSENYFCIINNYNTSTAPISLKIQAQKRNTQKYCCNHKRGQAKVIFGA